MLLPPRNWRAERNVAEHRTTLERRPVSPGLAQSRGAFERRRDFQRIGILQLEAFDDVRALIAQLRMQSDLAPEDEADGIDHQRIALPVHDGIAAVGGN